MVFSKAISLAVAGWRCGNYGGCATRRQSLAENFELTVQPKVRSAGHWELVSRDVVAQTLATLDKAGVAPGTQLHRRASSEPQFL